jgi:hypothetical protein
MLSNQHNYPGTLGWKIERNIWGWNFSFISLGIILFFLFLAKYRTATRDTKTITPGDDVQNTQTEMPKDNPTLNK